jgi:hypothetical protein
MADVFSTSNYWERQGRVSYNEPVLLQVGYFITSSPEQMLIENILLKITTKAK